MRSATPVYVLLFALFFLHCRSLTTDNTSDARDSATVNTLMEAYSYGLPLILMDLTRRQMENPSAGKAIYAPVNQFHHLSQLPDASFRDIVRPNADTYNSSAMLDLSAEPIIVSVPDTRGRYYMMSLLDAWTNVFAVPGTRTTGNGANNFCIEGPGWSGSLPADCKEIKAPTNLVWLIGRIQVNSKADGEKSVVPIQRQMKLTPLSAWLGKPLPPVQPADPSRLQGSPNEVVENMPIDSFFNYMLRLMKRYPAPEADTPFLEKIAAAGVRIGQPFDHTVYDTTVQSRVKTIPTRVLSQLKKEIAYSHDLINGWNISRKGVGSYGTDYFTRSMVAYSGLGANLPAAEAVSPICSFDADHQHLNGTHNYLLHFKKGETPPANAFWSITMYDADGYLVDNPLRRFTIGDRSHLTVNPDGSVDIYIRNSDPGPGRQSNWLPAPPGDFNLLMRIYNPQKPVLDGSWSPPAIQRI